MHRVLNVLGRRQYSRSIKSLIDIRPDIQEALNQKRPIVALESTIITHGMPNPYNLETALDVLEIVKEENAIPATIGIVNGRIKVGLTDHEILLLALTNKSMPTIKTSRRDMAYVLSKQWNGGTTVAGTLIVANMVGIDIFATGGIGGVHRDGQNTFDISADLTELGKSGVTVVSSGVKSILDIPRTLEYLETQGVTVSTFGSPEKDFPAFYTRKSGSKVPYNIDTAREAAELISASKTLDLKSGILIAVPIPEENAMDEKIIDNAIIDALQRAEEAGVSGKESTPFLLDAISTITKGKSLSTNIALIKNNARIASQIAYELSNLKSQTLHSINLPKNENLPKNSNAPVVIGGSNVDISYSITDENLQLDGATYNSRSQISGGGVGRNIAEAIAKINGCVHFISRIGNDQNGDYLLNLLPQHCRHAIERDNVQSTAHCAIIFDKCGDCKLHVANMDIHETITPQMVIRHEQFISKAPIVLFDGNLSIDTMGTILELCQKYNCPAFFEPTDMRIADKPFKLPTNLVRQIKFISPNIYELNTIAKTLNHSEIIDCTKISIERLFENDNEILSKIKSAATITSELIDNILVTLGPKGVISVRKNSERAKFLNENYQYIRPTASNSIVAKFYETHPIPNIVNVSGAGDSFTSGFVAALIHGNDEDVCVSVGIDCARNALSSNSPVAMHYNTSEHVSWRQKSKYNLI